jgi:hypothetical protein
MSHTKYARRAVFHQTDSKLFRISVVSAGSIEANGLGASFDHPGDIVEREAEFIASD